MVTATPLDNLSMKLIAPYTKAPLSVFSPMRSAVMPRLVTSMSELPAPDTHTHIYKTYIKKCTEMLKK